MRRRLVAVDALLPKPNSRQGSLPRLPSRLDKQAGKAVGEVPVTTNLIGPPGWPSYILVQEATAKGRDEVILPITKMAIIG